jgi:hypothetical protein
MGKRNITQQANTQAVTVNRRPLTDQCFFANNSQLLQDFGKESAKMVNLRKFKKTHNPLYFSAFILSLLFIFAV